MSLIIQKFGGTSIASIDRVKSVAERVANEVNHKNKVVVVVSAMAGVTNQLVEWAHTNVPNLPDPAEYDVVLSSGEQITSGLLALTLKGMGISARSWLAWQLPILTDGLHKQARISDIELKELLDTLQNDQVAVVAGFQGINSDGRVTTLGRGGSDITAVGLAHALKAKRCDIYTDVDGVFTADPRIVPEACKLDKIAYEEMLELAWQGAKVLQPRSVEIAMQYKIPLRVLSSFKKGGGSLICDESDIHHTAPLTAIASNRFTTLFTLIDFPYSDNKHEVLLRALEGANIHFETYNSLKGCSNFVFSTIREDAELVLEILESNQDQLGYKNVITDSDVSKVAVVGRGIRDSKAVANRISTTLTNKGIKVKELTTDDLKVTVIVSEAQSEETVRTLHAGFVLDQVANVSNIANITNIA